MKELEIKPIDMVVVNLYPFERRLQKKGVSMEEAIENIDIGGPSMIRSASKNYRYVIVIVNPKRYEFIIEELRPTAMTFPRRCALSLPLRHSGLQVVMTKIIAIILTAWMQKRRVSNSSFTGLYETAATALR